MVRRLPTLVVVFLLGACGRTSEDAEDPRCANFADRISACASDPSIERKDLRSTAYAVCMKRTPKSALHYNGELDTLVECPRNKSCRGVQACLTAM
jgi:hypothetical protein